MHSPIKITLQTPVVTLLGTTTDEIEIQPPEGIDILQSGYPFATSTDARTGNRVETVDYASMRRMIARCARLPDVSVDKMQAVEILQAVEAVTFFFHYRAVKASSKGSSESENGAATKVSSGT